MSSCPLASHQNDRHDQDRVQSSIPRTGGDKWMYPSPSMFTRALERKGHQAPDAQGSSVIVNIHNMVNEQCWQEVLRWEARQGNHTPKLERFLGRPHDLSPRAWFRHHILGYIKPFDRHDWYVDRGDGKPSVRYVIDFYQGKATDDNPMSFHLDVRPALDSWSALLHRFFK